MCRAQNRWAIWTIPGCPSSGATPLPKEASEKSHRQSASPACQLPASINPFSRTTAPTLTAPRYPTSNTTVGRGTARGLGRGDATSALPCWLREPHLCATLHVRVQLTHSVRFCHVHYITLHHTTPHHITIRTALLLHTDSRTTLIARSLSPRNRRSNLQEIWPSPSLNPAFCLLHRNPNQPQI